MKVTCIYDNGDFVSAQFDASQEETKQMAKLFGTTLKEMKGCWFWVGQFKGEDNILDCIQVYNDTWESNCDLTFSDFKEDCIKELQDFFHKIMGMTTAERNKEIGTCINMEVA